MFKRNHFVWNEPWFFSWRVRHWHSWCALAAMLLVAAAVTAAVLYFLAPRRPPNLQIVGLSLAVAGILWTVIDGPTLRRAAMLDADSLYVNGDFGKFSRQDRYPISKIQRAVIRTAEELKWPFPVLFLVVNGELEIVGINRSISLQRLASAMHGLGIPVYLEGWDPSAENGFAQTFQIEAGDPSAIRPTAQINPLPSGELKLWTPIGMIVAIIQQCWAGAIALAAIIGSVVYLYQNWGQIGLVEVVLAIVIPIAVMYLAGMFTDRFASASTSNTIIKHAKNQIRRRRNVQLRIDAENLYPVEILREDQFAKTIQKIHELGFVEVDTQRRRLLFEGKTERWELPAECLRKLAIQEVQTGAAGDSQMGQANYYVLIEFDTLGQQEKFGLRSGKRDYGEFTDVKRAQQAIELFEMISPLLELTARTQQA